MLGVYEKELLAVIHALSSWKHYLLGTPFILRTDHQSLRYFMTQTKLSEKKMRWAKFLSQFHFHIAHVPGKQNAVADALSRRPHVNAITIAHHKDLSLMVDDYKQDPDFASIYQKLKQGQMISPYSIKDGFLMHGQCLCITKAFREKVMQESHEPPYAGHRGVQATILAMEIYFHWPRMSHDIQEYISQCMICQKMKYDRTKPYGLLQRLPMPEVLWERIAMDFTFGLLRSQQSNNGRWTIVDKFGM